MTEGPAQGTARVDPPGGGRLPENGSPGRGRGLDRALGIVLGVVLGVGIVTAFVFLGSEDTIDAPRISGEGGIGAGGGEGAQKQEQRSRQQKAQGRQDEAGQAQSAGAASLPLVTVIGGAPPASGPPRLDFKLGGRVRFRISTDAPVAIEIPGYGIAETVGSDAVISFRATRPGQFPVIASASHIGIASLRIER